MRVMRKVTVGRKENGPANEAEPVYWGKAQGLRGMLSSKWLVGGAPLGTGRKTATMGAPVNFA